MTRKMYRSEKMSLKNDEQGRTELCDCDFT